MFVLAGASRHVGGFGNRDLFVQRLHTRGRRLSSRHEFKFRHGEQWNEQPTTINDAGLVLCRRRGESGPGGGDDPFDDAGAAATAVSVHGRSILSPVLWWARSAKIGRAHV